MSNFKLCPTFSILLLSKKGFNNSINSLFFFLSLLNEIKYPVCFSQEKEIPISFVSNEFKVSVSVSNDTTS